MNKGAVIAISSIVLLAGGTAGYMYWQNQQNETGIPQAETPVTQTEDTGPAYPLKPDNTPTPIPLPALEQSDAFVMEAFNTLLADPALAELFINEKIIQNIVTSIDNLPSKSLPLKIMPVKTAQSTMITMGSGNTLAISPQNAERYLPYINILNAANTQQLVQLYIRLYPLMQQAYEELGYPDKYFNDRLIAVIDHLLAAPDVTEPVKLVQPLVVYKYANPELENRSIGQRIMMRIGNTHEATLKTKLREIKQVLLNYVDELKK